MVSNSFHPKIRPPHVQVAEALSSLIRHMRPGDQLPPEPELARQLGVSRATLREVVRTFIERSLLVRRHGVGTFVASRIPVLDAGLEVLESLGRMADRLGLVTKMAYLEMEERFATPIECLGLGFADDSEVEVLVVNRVITVEDEPVADLRDIVPLHFLRKEDLGVPFQGSVLDVFLQRGTPLLSTSRTEMTPVLARKKFSSRLKVANGSVLLKLEAQLYSFDEKVIDYSVSYFVPGHFKFHVMRKVIHQ